jgi:hypothetical protein
METKAEPGNISPVVSANAWHLFRVRPNNHPSRRITGMAELLNRAWDVGLVEWSSALVSTENIAAIKNALTVAGLTKDAETSIGASRAADLAVNVVLPFVHSWGFITKITALPEGALALYRAWPPLQENALTRETLRVINFRTVGVSGITNESEFKRTARRQQGLIYLYKKHFQGH